MPLLSDEHLSDMRSRPPETCHRCKRKIRQNYCRQCDEYFMDGHAADCPTMLKTGLSSDDHRGHRTY